MSIRRRRVLYSVIAALAALAAGAALAWACTPQAGMSVSPPSGPPGTTITVSGRGFDTGTVEVHWNNATGAIVARAQGPSFSASFPAPESGPGVYYVTAVSRDGAGQVSWTLGRPFQIVPAVAQSPASGADEAQPPAAVQPVPAAPGGSQPQRAAARTRGAQPLRARGRARGDSKPGVGGPQTTPVPTLGRTRAGRAAVRASAAPRPEARRNAVERSSRAEQAQRPSERTASGDLTSGLWPTTRPLAVSLGDRPPPGGGPSGDLTLATGLLGTGLLTLGAAVLVALARRRRAASARQRR